MFISDDLEQFDHSNYLGEPKQRLQQASSWMEGLAGLNGKNWKPPTINNQRLLGLYFGVILAALIITGRLFVLQVVRGSEYYVKSERNHIYTKSIFPERGVIYDRNGQVLARNSPSFSVGIVYADLPRDNLDQIEKKLSQTFQISPQKLEEAVSYARQNPFREVIVKRNLSYEANLAFQARREQFPGVFVTHSVVRSYPADKSLSPVLGYTGALGPNDLASYNGVRYTVGSTIGRAGIEKQYESELVGKLGKAMLEVEARGEVRQETILQQPEPGNDVTLTLDLNLQKQLGKLLEEAMRKYQATAATAIISDPQTGEVLAMISLPTYDNNLFSQGNKVQELKQVLDDPRGLLVNRAISGLYAPGSTVKVAIGAFALQRGVITANTRLSGKPQIIRVGKWEFPDWTVSWGRGPHGLMDLPRAIAVSSDIFFYKISGGYPPRCLENGNQTPRCEVEGLQASGLVEALEKFGFGNRTGIDLPNEAYGLVPDPQWKRETRGESWFLGNTYHLGIGQGDLLATPVQVLNMTNIIAIDSKTPQLHLLKDTELAEKYGLDKTQTKPVSLEYIRIAREGMRKAVSEGIVYPLRGATVPVAAKTGTAEFGSLNAEGEYNTHAWVTGFAPANDPQVSFVFMLEAGGQSSNAANLARQFIDQYFLH